jgi:hypothetical protein
MKNITIEYLLIAFLGMTIHILIHILNRKNKSIPLSLSYYISDLDNWIRLILSVLSIFSLLLMSDSLSNILGIKLENGAPAKDVFAFLTGYLNHSLIKNVLRLLKK